jgi:hypothetical protein
LGFSIRTLHAGIKYSCKNCVDKKYKIIIV